MISLPVPAYILAGGRSSRFGSDKARACLGQTPMLVGLADSLRAMAASVIVVADRPGKYADLGLPTIADEIPGLGPLGGLVTALRHRQDSHGPGWMLLVSCDWAELRPAWVEQLWLAAANTGNGIVAFNDGRWQSLLAMYHTSILPLADEHAAGGTRRMNSLLDDAAAVGVRPPADWSMRFQINNRAALQAYLASR